MDVRTRWLQVEWPVPTAMIELLVCLIIAGAMVGVAARGAHRIAGRLGVLEAVGFMSVAKVSMMEFRAVTGEWPASSERAQSPGQHIVQGSRLAAEAIRGGGAVDYVFSAKEIDLAGKMLTFRAWQNAGSTDAPVAWLCGHASAMSMIAASEDRTTLSDDELPSPCRQHK